MLSFTDHWIGYIALAVFLAAYVLVIVEENLGLRKSKPVMVAAGAIWILTAIAYASQHQSHAVAEILRIPARICRTDVVSSLSHDFHQYDERTQHL